MTKYWKWIHKPTVKQFFENLRPILISKSRKRIAGVDGLAWVNSVYMKKIEAYERWDPCKSDWPASYIHRAC